MLCCSLRAGCPTEGPAVRSRWNFHTGARSPSPAAPAALGPAVAKGGAPTHTPPPPVLRGRQTGGLCGEYCIGLLGAPRMIPGPSRPKVPTLPGSEGSLFFPRAGWSAGADGNTDLRLPPSSLSSSSGQGSSRLLRLAEFTPRSVSSISFPQIVFLREPRPQLPSPFKGVRQPNDIYQTPTSTSDERGREG